MSFDLKSLPLTTFFNQTKNRVKIKTACNWLKILDNDSLRYFLETLKRIDMNATEGNPVDPKDPNTEACLDCCDVIALSHHIWEWETGNYEIQIDIENLFTLSSFVQYEWNRRYYGTDMVLGGLDVQKTLKDFYKKNRGRVSFVSGPIKGENNGK